MRVERAGLSEVKERMEALKRKLEHTKITKSKPKPTNIEAYELKLAEQEADMEQRRRERKEKKQKTKEMNSQQEDEFEQTNDQISVMMGFGNFSSTK
jgi:hypothetical protein